ncbi:unnamed protein product [Rotaria sordida]|uniref:Uncharacterized protein n=1 Tax=Rotaria sordida TaxID=392033 RepID=A0A814C7T0_9BILA|nr:unnamed protein product [Rotaria sordida]
MNSVGLATVYQIHQRHLHIHPLTINHNTHINQLRKRDHQLLKMTFLYTTFTQGISKSDFQLAIENILAQIMRMLVFINSSASLYAFLASGHEFRYEFDHFIVKIITYLFG